MKTYPYILLSLFLILSSCSQNLYPLYHVKNIYPQTTSEAIPQEVFQNSNLNYSFYSTNKIKLEDKSIEFVLYLNGLNASISEKSLKKGIISIINSNDSIAPSLDIFHNSTSSAGLQTLAINNSLYEFKIISQDKPKIELKKLKKIQNITPDMTYDLSIPKSLKVYEFNKNREQKDFSEILKGINQDTILISFWNCNCPGCFEKVPRLNKFIKEGKYGLINFNSNSNSIQDAKRMHEKYPFPGINLKSEMFFERYFNQNGYPYYCLLDKKSMKVIKSWVGDFELN